MCPRARQPDVEMEVLAGKVVRIGSDAELRCRSGVMAGRVGRCHLGHHELPGRGPGGPDGGYQYLRR